MNVMVDDRNAYARELDQAGWPRLLDAARIQADVDGSEGRRIIAETTKVYDRYRTVAIGALAMMRSKLVSAPVSEASRRQALNGFDTGRADQEAALVHQLDLERDVLQQVVDVHDWSRRNLSGWTASDGQFLFQRDEDLREFQRLTAIVAATTATQQNLQGQSAKRAKERLTR